MKDKERKKSIKKYSKVILFSYQASNKEGVITNQITIHGIESRIQVIYKTAADFLNLTRKAV